MDVCFVSSFLRMYAYLGGGECDITAMSHVVDVCHVSEAACQPMLVGSGRQRCNGRQRWLAKSGGFNKYI